MCKCWVTISSISDQSNNAWYLRLKIGFAWSKPKGEDYWMKNHLSQFSFDFDILHAKTHLIGVPLFQMF